MARRVTRRLAAVVSVAAIGLALAGCTAGSDAADPPSQPTGTSVNETLPTSAPAPSTSGSSSPSDPPSTAPQTPSATVTVDPEPAKGEVINPATPISVQVADGTLTAVRLTNDSGKAVKGELAPDSHSWTSTEPLGYSRTYTLSAVAKNADGVTSTKKAKYTTVTPSNMTMPYFQYTGGYKLHDGDTYGVGIVPVVHFDEPISDKKAAVATLTVTTTPHVAGSWYWPDDQNAAFRPKEYWPAHTQVSIAANVYGKQVSPGLYGQADAKISFKIGDKHVTIAEDNAPKVNKVKVYFNDKLVKKWNTSMGKHQTQTYGNKTISFYTMDGTYTVIAHENPAHMTSASYGIPKGAPGSYDELIYWATKISTDGIYLHQLDTTVWAQDNGYDVSHGCLNLRGAYAKWFYQHSQIGDVVEVRGTKGAPKIEYWQGGAWSVPWKTWTAGGFTVA
jgi:lipoprotein-anchoring transpeptidase ErfK/SrfK